MTKIRMHYRKYKLSYPHQKTLRDYDAVTKTITVIFENTGLCRDCCHCKHKNTNTITQIYVCSKGGFGVYPRDYDTPHPKCPLKRKQKE